MCGRIYRWTRRSRGCASKRYQGRIQYHNQLPGRTAEYAPLAITPRLNRLLAANGIDQLYHHQATAIQALREGQNVVIATPTASGKSLVYTVPAIERALNHGGCTLYIAPQRALINDQEATLSEYVTGLGSPATLSVDQYTGRLSQSEKRAVRERQPTIILTTPDMLHYALLPWGHRQWEWFFRQLETVVLDEVHEYRGVFGSHVALVCRRLARVCERYGSRPQFVCCSATIGNPVEHASAVTGQPDSSFALVDEDTSATGQTHWLFWNPPLKQDAARNTDETDTETDNASTYTDEPHEKELSAADGGTVIDAPAATATTAGGDRISNHPESVRLCCDLVIKGYQTLVFTRARQGAEQYANWCSTTLRNRGKTDLADTITAYQAALTTSRQRTIESELQNGQLRGVWSTSALEIGVDIGGLDVVVLDGYPGTRMQTFQRAGRAGRGEDASLVTIVGSPNQLDQYIMRHPTIVFDTPPEQAVVNPHNEQLLPTHILSAAQEHWLAPTDREHFGPTFPGVVADLEQAGQLERRQTEHGLRWTYTGTESPQHDMSIRTIDDRDITLIDQGRDTTLGTLSFRDAVRDVHPAAIYHHQVGCHRTVGMVFGSRSRGPLPLALNSDNTGRLSDTISRVSVGYVKSSMTPCHQGHSYEVGELDLDRDRALLESTPTSRYTRALRDKRITVEESHRSKALAATDAIEVTLAEITVREQIDSYIEYEGPRDEEGTKRQLAEPLPEVQLSTQALMLTLPASITQAVAPPESEALLSGLHALEHALISLFPLELLCDRGDIGGLSTPQYPATDTSTIFVHDTHPGGVGLAQGGYEHIESLLAETQSLLADAMRRAKENNRKTVQARDL